VAAGIQAAHFMITDREAHLSSQKGWLEGRLPAMRGRLVSQEGIPLAWSVRRFRLEYTVAQQPEQLQKDYFAVQECIDLTGTASWETAGHHVGSTVVLRDDLSADAILRLSQLVGRNPRLRITSRFERKSMGSTPAARQMIGRTRMIDQVEVGISGWERDYDARLRGLEGRFRVMVDRNGDWIQSTWEELQAPEPGNDVFVPASVRAE
jgi:cell division protein FtsI/penicillin-binding protein 2